MRLDQQRQVTRPRHRRAKLPPEAAHCRALSDRLNALTKRLSAKRDTFYPPITIPWFYIYDVLRESKRDLALQLSHTLASAIHGHSVSPNSKIEILSSEEIKAIGEADFIGNARAFVNRNARLIAQTRLEVAVSDPKALGRRAVGVWDMKKIK